MALDFDSETLGVSDATDDWLLLLLFFVLLDCEVLVLLFDSAVLVLASDLLDGEEDGGATIGIALETRRIGEILLDVLNELEVGINVVDCVDELYIYKREDK